LIRNIEPDTRELVAYIVAARERRMTLNRTRLVKLLYLVDVPRRAPRPEAVRGRAQRARRVVRRVATDRRPDDSLILEYPSQQLRGG
jgi:hypothetical protein